MWKVGDKVQQMPSIFRNQEVGMSVMTIKQVIYPKGKDTRWPLEVVTEHNGRLYRWRPEALQEPHSHLTTPTIWGGSSWE